MREIAHSHQHVASRVFLYSIPTLDETGDGEQIDGADLGSAKLQLEGGEVLISKLNPRKARVLFAQPHDVPTVASLEFVALQPTGIDRRFLAYLLQGEHLRQTLDANTRSVTRSQQRVSADVIAKTPLELPDRGEQRAIADYLDRETARIDALIAAKQRMIELLDERWQADVSGVMDSPELSRIPVRRVIRTIEQGWSPRCEARLPEGDEWCVLKTGAVNGMRFRRNEVKALPHDTSPDPRFQVHDGDILMSRANTKELVGSIGLVRDIRPRTLLCDKLFRLVTRRDVDADFFVLALQTRATRLQLVLEASGASDSMQNIGQDTVLRLTIPVMSTESQRRVSRQLLASHEHIEAAKATLAVTCDRLTERRTALITTAVTGALEVPRVTV